MNNKKKNDMKYTMRRHLGTHCKVFKGVKGLQGQMQIRPYNESNPKEQTKPDTVIEYVNPDTHSLIMYGCRLFNDVPKASKIYANRHVKRDTGKESKDSKKKPCSWVEFESYEIVPLDFPVGEELRYNPRKAVHWNTESEDNIDFTSHDIIITSGTQLFKG